MIRKLTQEDNNELMKLIMKEPEVNLYIIGDIENFGYDKSFLEFFGEFNESGVLSAVLVRYFSIFNFYGEDEFDINGFVNIMKNYNDVGMLSGKTNIVSKFEKTSLKFSRLELHYLAMLKEINESFTIDKKINVKKASIQDIERIADLRGKIKEFSHGSHDFKEIVLNDFKSGTAHGYYVEVDDKIVSYAQTSAENSRSAMVVSVMTDSEYRRNGFASACVKAICEDLIKQGKTPCLFYKNPAAGAIYKSIGFKEIDFWSMYM